MSTITKLFTITSSGIELENKEGDTRRYSYKEEMKRAAHFVELFGENTLPPIPYSTLKAHGLWNLPSPNAWKLECSGVTYSVAPASVTKQELTVYLPKNKNGEDITFVVINETKSNPIELSTHLEVRINGKVISHRRYIFDNSYANTKELATKALASFKRVLVNIGKDITEDTNDALSADKLMVTMGTLFVYLVHNNRSTVNINNYLIGFHEAKYELLNNPLATIVECTNNGGRVDFGIKTHTGKLVLGVSLTDSCKYDKVDPNNKHEYCLEPRTDVVFTVISDLKQLDEPNPEYTKKRYIMKDRVDVISLDNVLSFTASLNNLLLNGWGEGNEYAGNVEDAIAVATDAMGLQTWIED